MTTLRLDVAVNGTALEQLRNSVRNLSSDFKTLGGSVGSSASEDLKRKLRAVEGSLSEVKKASNTLKRSVVQDGEEMAKAFAGFTPALDRIGTSLDKLVQVMERSTRRTVSSAQAQKAAYREVAEAAEKSSAAQIAAAQRTAAAEANGTGRQVLGRRGSAYTLKGPEAQGAKALLSEAAFEENLTGGSLGKLEATRRRLNEAIFAISSNDQASLLAAGSRYGDWLVREGSAGAMRQLDRLNARIAELTKEKAAGAATAVRDAANFKASQRDDLQQVRTSIRASKALGAGYDEGRVRNTFGDAAVDAAKLQGLDALRAKYDTLRGGSDRLKESQHSLREGKEALKATMRGLAAGVDSLWLSWGRYVAVAGAVYGATSAIRKSFQEGMELDFQTRFAAALENGQGAGRAAQLQEQLYRESQGTTKSATELAGALRALSQAGYEGAEGLQLVRTISKAATIDQVDAKKAAEELTGAMDNLGLHVKGNVSATTYNFNRLTDVVMQVSSATKANLLDVTSAFNSLLGASQQFGTSLEFNAYLIQRLATAGIKGPSAGTLARNFQDDILGANSKASRQLKADLALGGQKIELFDRTKDNPVEYIERIVEALRKLKPGEASKAIQGLSDERGRKVLNLLYTDTVRLSQGIEDLGNKAPGSIDRFYKALEGTTRIEWQTTQAAGMNLLAKASQDAQPALVQLARDLRAAFQDPATLEALKATVSAIGSLASTTLALLPTLVKVGAVYITIRGTMALATAALTAYNASTKLSTALNLESLRGLSLLKAGSVGYGGALKRLNDQVNAAAASKGRMAVAVSGMGGKLLGALPVIGNLVSLVLAGAAAWELFGKKKDKALNTSGALQSLKDELKADAERNQLTGGMKDASEADQDRYVTLQKELATNRKKRYDESQGKYDFTDQIERLRRRSSATGLSEFERSELEDERRALQRQQDLPYNVRKREERDALNASEEADAQRTLARHVWMNKRKAAEAEAINSAQRDQVNALVGSGSATLPDHEELRRAKREQEREASDAEKAALRQVRGASTRAEDDAKTQLGSLNRDEQVLRAKKDAGLVSESDYTQQLDQLLAAREEAIQARADAIQKALDGARGDVKTAAGKETLAQQGENAREGAKNEIATVRDQRKTNSALDEVKFQALQREANLKRDSLTVELEMERDLQKAKEDSINLSGKQQAELEARQRVIRHYGEEELRLIKLKAEYEKDPERAAAIQKQIDLLREKRDVEAKGAAQTAGKKYDKDMSAGAGWDNFKDKVKKDADNVGAAVEQGLNTTLDRTTDALAELATTGKMNFRAFATDLLKELAKIAMRQAILKMLSAIMGGGKDSNNNTNNTTTSAGTNHTGGIVGREATSTRQTSLTTFHGAPRYHTGGIVGDEVPAILQRGEGVFTQQQMKHLAPVSATTGGTQVTQIFHVTVQSNGKEDGKSQGEAISRELLAQMRAVAVSTIIDEKRNGGVLANG